MKIFSVELLLLSWGRFLAGLLDCHTLQISQIDFLSFTSISVLKQSNGLIRLDFNLVWSTISQLQVTIPCLSVSTRKAPPFLTGCSWGPQWQWRWFLLLAPFLLPQQSGLELWKQTEQLIGQLYRYFLFLIAIPVRVFLAVFCFSQVKTKFMIFNNINSQDKVFCGSFDNSDI